MAKGFFGVFWHLLSTGMFGQLIRHGIVVALNKMKAMVITDLEATIELTSGDMKVAIVRLAIELGIFNVLAQKKQATLDDLAAPREADKQLTFRVMRFLTSTGLARAINDTTFASTKWGLAYVDGSALRDAVFHFTTVGRATARLADYLKEINYQEPKDANHACWQYAYGTKEHYFQWINDNPEDLSAFNNLMSLSRLNIIEDWYEFYPVNQRLAGVAPEHPLLVDIGGGLGHDIAAFRRANPNLPGRLILQDLPGVVKEAESTARYTQGIEVQAHNFFDPQPVKGARVYYLRTVLHDWPDDKAQEILAHIKKAMNKDSILLLNENVLHDGPLVSEFEARLDFSMMITFSALERTRAQWTDLLTRSGFELIKIWSPRLMTPGAGLIFEAKLKV